MSHEFARKKEKLAEIIANRDVSAATIGSRPSKFSFVKIIEPDGVTRLKCVWTKALSGRDKPNMLIEIHIPAGGFSPDEWDSLTKRFWDYL